MRRKLAWLGLTLLSTAFVLSLVNREFTQTAIISVAIASTIVALIQTRKPKSASENGGHRA